MIVLQMVCHDCCKVVTVPAKFAKRILYGNSGDICPKCKKQEWHWELEIPDGTLYVYDENEAVG